MSLANIEPSDLLLSSLRKTRCVIFDFDGVVADSEPYSLGTLQRTLADFGIPMTLDAVRDEFLGKSLTTIEEYVGQQAPAAGFEQAWQARLFAAFRADLGAMPEIEKLLDSLNRAQIRYCVASSSSFERLGVALDAIGLAQRFPNLFSAEQVKNGKPAPDLFLHAAAQMQVAPTDCLVIEDSPHGIRAATAAGMDSVGFIGGSHLDTIRSHHAIQLINQGADHIIDQLGALIAALGRDT